MASATTEDWQLNKSVLESNKHVLENQLYCDVTFVFNEDKSNQKQVSISLNISHVQKKNKVKRKAVLPKTYNIGLFTFLSCYPCCAIVFIRNDV